jgi:hypothetical protein
MLPGPRPGTGYVPDDPDLPSRSTNILPKNYPNVTRRWSGDDDYYLKISTEISTHDRRWGINPSI